ncbi:uncharacterized protein LOC118438097 [Folsomia candida]|uniref:uncharacterized protein LOC118438097 n=1 Tax=Folsomia candida TaxID=158441 RepID=UPI001604C192|nr:uncharacterized protein LOC118438097 [Folsomia candida]
MICLGPLKIGNLYSSGSSTNQTCSHPFHFACIVEGCRTQKGENEFKKLAPVQPTCPICVRPIKFLFPLDEENGVFKVELAPSFKQVIVGVTNAGTPLMSYIRTQNVQVMGYTKTTNNPFAAEYKQQQDQKINVVVDKLF